MANDLQSNLGFVDPRYESGRSNAFTGTLELGAHDMLQMFSAFGYAMANRFGNDTLRDRFGRAYQAEQGYGNETLSELPTFRQEQLASPIGFDNLSFATFGAQFLRNAPSFAVGGAAAFAGGVPGALAAGGVLGGGDAMSSIVNYFSSATDEEIAANPAFADLAASGMTPAEIKQHALDTTIGYKDIGSTLLSAGLGLIAPETVLGRMLGGHGIHLGIGRVPGIALGAGGAAVEGGLEEAIPAVVQNEASKTTGGAIPETSVEQAMIAGAILEAPAGGVAGFSMGGSEKQPPPHQNPNVTVVPPGTPNPAQTAALNPPAATPGAAAPTTGATSPIPPATGVPPGAAAAINPAQPAAVATPPTPAVPTSPAAVAPTNAPQVVQGTVPGSNVAPPPSPGPVPTPPPRKRTRKPVAAGPVEATTIQDAGAVPNTQAIPEQALPETKTAPVVTPAVTTLDPTDQILRSDGWKPAEIMRLTPEQKIAQAQTIIASKPHKAPQGYEAPVEAIPEAAPPPAVEPPAVQQGAPPSVQTEAPATPLPGEGQVEPTAILEAPTAISTLQGALSETPPVEEPQPTMQEAFAPSTVPAPIIENGRRILKPVQTAAEIAAEKAAEQEAVAAQRAAANRQREKTKRAETQAQNPILARKDLTPEEKQKLAVTDPANAQQVIEANPPPGEEGDYQNYGALQTRLQAIVDGALAKDVKIPDKVTKNTPNHIVWLANAKKTLKQLDKSYTSQETKDAVLKYQAGEGAALSGAAPELAFSVFRGEHGSNTSGRSGGGAGQQSKSGAKQTTSDVEKLGDEGQRVQDEVDEGSPVAEARAVQQDIAEDTSTEITETKQEPIKPAPKPQKEVVEGVDYTKPKENRGAVVVQNIRERQKALRGEGPVAKVTLKPRAKPTEQQVAAETKHVETNVETVSRETTSGVTTPDLPRRSRKKFVYEKPADVQARSDAAKNALGAVEFADGNWVVPVDETTVGAEIEARRGEHQKGRYGAAQNTIADHILSLAARVFPDMKIYVLNDQDMGMALGEYDVPDEQTAVGYYHRDRGDGKGEYIVLSGSSYIDTEGEGRQTLVHELLHAFTFDAIIGSDTLVNKFQAMLDEMRLVHGDRGSEIYGLTNVFEFFAELSNPDFVRMLKEMPVSRETAKYFGLETWRKATGWNAFIALIRKIIGKVVSNNSDFNMYDVLLSSTERFTHAHDKVAAIRYKRAAQRAGVDEGFANTEKEFVKARAAIRNKRNPNPPNAARRINKYFTAPVPQNVNTQTYAQSAAALAQNTAQKAMYMPGRLKRFFMRFRSLDDLMRAHEHLFTDGALRRYVNSIIKRYTLSMQRIGEDSKLLAEEKGHLKKYEGVKIGGVSATEHYAELAHAMDNWKVDPRIPLAQHHWLGINAIKGVVAKSHYPQIEKMYKQLQAAAPDLATYLGKRMDYFAAKERQGQDAIITDAVIDAAENNGNSLTNAAALTLGRKLIDSTATQADKDVVGDTAAKRIAKTPEFKPQYGPYQPQRRWGDWVVSAHIDVADPTHGTWVRPPADKHSNLGGYNVDFHGTDAQANAEKFASEVNGKPRDINEYAEVKKIITDSSGFEHVQSGQYDGHKYEIKDPGTETRWRVYIQDEHAAFFESQHEADQAVKQLSGDQYYKTVKPTRLRRGEPAPTQALAGSHQLMAIAESLKRRMKTMNAGPQAIAQFNSIIREAAYRAAPGTSISRSRIQRRNVQGASRDTLRVMHDYILAINNYIAAVETARETNEAHKALVAQVDTQYGKPQIDAQSVLNEIEKRQNAMAGMQEKSDIVNIATSWQVLDKLFSPAYSITNMMQLPMVGLPVLAEKHGLFAASRAITKAMKQIGYVQNLKMGGKDTWAAMRGRLDVATSFHEFIKSGNLTPEVKTMLDKLVEYGSLDPDAGFEAMQIIAKSGVSSMFNKVEAVFRQFPRAVEANSRYTLALAAYELAKNKGWSVEKATEHARDVVERSQFNYNPANSAPIFNTTIGQVGFQFLKFGFNMYQLMGSQISTILGARNATKAERIEALRGFALLMAAHALVGGVAGLPTEPLRAVFMVLKASGITDVTWDDVEASLREYVSDAAGSSGFAEILARGLPRMLGMDWSNRLTLGQLVLQKEMDDLDAPGGVAGYMMRYIGGPAVQNADDLFVAIRALGNGDVPLALEKGLPIKMLSDAVKAYRGAGEGIKTKYGDVYQTYDIPGTIMQTLGVTPAANANVTEGRNRYFSLTNRAADAEAALKQEYLSATPAERAKFIPKIRDYNKTWTPAQPLTLGDMRDYLAGKGGPRDYKKGIKVEPANRRVLEQIESTYQ